MKALDVAKDLIYLMDRYGYEVNYTKLQKLLYIVVGLALRYSIRQSEIIYYKDNAYFFVIDEVPEAWQYGPVFKNVYAKIRSPKYVSEEINILDALKVNAEDYKMSIMQIDDGNSSLKNLSVAKMTIIINEIASHLGNENTKTLIDWSCKEGTPWHQTIAKNNKTGSGVLIEPSLMKKYFSKIDKIFQLDLKIIDEKLKKLDDEFSNLVEERKRQIESEINQKIYKKSAKPHRL